MVEPKKEYEKQHKNNDQNAEGYYYKNLNNIIVTPWRPQYGRRTKCTPEATQLIAKAISEGLSRDSAARALGFAPVTLKAWHKRGSIEFHRLISAEETDRDATIDQDEEPFLLFYEAVTVAWVIREKKLLDNMSEAAKDPKHWRANLELLQIAFPERYQSKHTVEIVDWRTNIVNLLKEGQPITLEMIQEHVNDETEIKRLYERAELPFPTTREGDKSS